MIIILVGLCFKSSSSKSLEICLIVFNSILFFFTLLSFILIKWAYISYFNLVMFILLFIIIIINIILSSFIRYWRNKNLIKNEKKEKGNTFAKTGLGLTIILLIFTIIEEFAFSIGLPGIILNIEDKSSLFLMLFISYLTFSFLEYFSIFGIILWCFLKDRIINGLDNPNAPQIQTQPVVIQPVYINGQGNVPTIGPYNNLYNNANALTNGPYNIPHMNENAQSNNIQETFNLPNQINTEIPNSQETKLK